jgi:hypothetical protein
MVGGTADIPVFCGLYAHSCASSDGKPLSDGFVRKNGGRVAVDHDAAFLHHVTGIADGRGAMDILFDQPKPDALIAHATQGFEDFVDDHRRKTLRGLVNQKQPRIAD